MRVARRGRAILGGLLLVGALVVVTPAPVDAHDSGHECRGWEPGGFSCRRIIHATTTERRVEFSIFFDGVRYSGGIMPFVSGNSIGSVFMCTHDETNGRRGAIRIFYASGAIRERRGPEGGGCDAFDIPTGRVDSYRLVFRGSDGSVAHGTITYAPPP